MEHPKLKKKIMRRVYAIWFVRRGLPLAAGSFALLFMMLREIARDFFVAKVAANFLQVTSSSIWAAPRFVESALLHADPAALLAISISGLLSFALAIKLLRSIRSMVGSSAPSLGMDYNRWE